MNLNHRSAHLCNQLLQSCCDLRVSLQRLENGTALWDFGVSSPGGLDAGVFLARVCLADLAKIRLVPDELTGASVVVHTDDPVRACMASQYAGWQINPEGYFAMGSGPMRAAAGVEQLFDVVGGRVESTVAVGVIETSTMPTAEVAHWIAEKCRVQPGDLSLLAARTASQAGNLQVVARSVETAMHKLFDLGYPLDTVESGMGSAPLPPVAADDLTGIGRTNDAILYGGQVTLWVRNDDEALAEIIEKIPSCASRDFGQPFQSIFAKYDHDFYKIDPHLFSPAVIRLVNLKTGHSFHAGHTRTDLLRESFFGSGTA